MANDTIKINELADGSLALNTLTVFADQNGLAFKRNLSDFKDFLATLDSLSFKGKLLIADTPVDGWYFAGESGTYTNAGGLVVDVSDNISIIIVSNSVTTFDKVDIPVTITIDLSVEEDSPNAVSGGAVYSKIESQSTVLLDFDYTANDGFYLDDGTINSSDARNQCFRTNQPEGTKFKITTRTYNTAMFGVIFRSDDLTVIGSKLLRGNNTAPEDFVDYEFTTPVGSTIVDISFYRGTYDDSGFYPTIEKYNSLSGVYDKINLSKADKTEVLTKTNTTPYTPTEDYHPAINKDVVYLKTKQDEILEETKSYEEETTYTNESVNGYYNKTTGAFVVSSGQRSRKYTINEDDTIYATGVVSGSLINFVCYYDENDDFISSELSAVDNSTRTYTRELLTVPSGTVYIGIITTNTQPYGILEKQVVSIITDSELTEALKPINVGEQTGNSIAWFGTSIPASGYPEMVGERIGATVYNEAVPSSMARAYHGVTGTFKDLGRDNCLRSLGQSLADKQNLIDNWKTGLDVNGDLLEGGTYGWRNFLVGASDTSEITDYDTEANILGYSYEKKLEAKYLDSTSPDFVEMPDYFVFEHAHNDLILSSYDTSDASAISIPNPRNDRKFCNGALSFMFELIYKYNARPKIIIISHYEDQKRPRITDAMQVLSDFWSFPYFKMYEKLGLNNNLITTTGYWSGSTWVESGGAEQQLTPIDIAMEDGLHPYSLPTKEKFARALSLFFTTQITY